jgi:hypothetical protein
MVVQRPFRSRRFLIGPVADHERDALFGEAAARSRPRNTIAGVALRLRFHARWPSSVTYRDRPFRVP